MSDVVVGSPPKLARVQAPWQREKGIEAVLSGWDQQSVGNNFALHEIQDPKNPQHAPLPDDLGPGLKRALADRGIEELYTHQAEAYRLARAGHDVVIATPTASGKSLCYNLPVLQTFAEQSNACAIYLFPTKALARDQEASLQAFLQAAELQHPAITYDGDTPGDARRVARERAAVLVTNPDMLHSGILPHHTNWSRLLSNLRYVIIDELHMYRGVFGSHIANLLRRLHRIASFHGAEPTFIMSSATIGNPEAHAHRITGRPVKLVDQSGAPTGRRHVMVYNPPIVNSELGIRQSYIKASTRIAADLLRAEVPTMVFGPSRNAVEVMLKYLREKVADKHIPADAIQGYRGGYLPETRRRIEQGLRNGDILGVVATNALELGIDIGALDAVICAGYPGSISGLWQRFGRAGRRTGDSIAILVNSSAPLDQYLANQPRTIMGAPIEHARIDPDNLEILLQHLKCAAFELPFERDEQFGTVAQDQVNESLDFLTESEVLFSGMSSEGKQAYHWATDHYPATTVSLRAIGWDNFVIIDVESGKTIAELDWRATHTMLHEQAIYQHDAAQFQVERLDFENHKAFVRKVEPDYYTTAQKHTKLSILEEADRGQGANDVSIGHGEVSLIEKVVGYKKIKYHTHENVGFGEVRLPEIQVHTTSMWIEVPAEVCHAVQQPRTVVVDALRGVGQCLHTVACVALMTDPRDLGFWLKEQAEGTEAKTGPEGFDPTLFFFDRTPGGIGLAPRLFEDRDTFLAHGQQALARCDCDDGCPACIGPADPSELEISRKGLASLLFRFLREPRG